MYIAAKESRSTKALVVAAVPAGGLRIYNDSRAPININNSALVEASPLTVLSDGVFHKPPKTMKRLSIAAVYAPLRTGASGPRRSTSTAHGTKSSGKN